jgi:hypothetical protein
MIDSIFGEIKDECGTSFGTWKLESAERKK